METQVENIKNNVRMCLQVLRKYDWLLNLYVLDFFVEKHWYKLPRAWRDCFKNMDPKDLGKILCGQQTEHMLPLTFLSLIKVINTLSLPRNVQPQHLETGTVTTVTDYVKFKNLFLKHVKLKKRHEINVMTKFVSHTANRNKCDTVLDCGSGLGHLVRILAYKYNLNAAGIEGNTSLTEQARKLDMEYEYTAKKHISGINISETRPSHFNIILTHPGQFKELQYLKSCNAYGLVGLHPCGDLGPFLIKHFVSCPKVKFICVVGCCYMKLSCGIDDDDGYPMSKFVKKLDNELSYATREISCHAIERYTERLCKGDYQDLKVHAYRAALEKLLVDFNPKLRRKPVRSVKHTNNLSFERYCEKALSHLCVRLPLSYDNARVSLLKWKRVVVLYTLRLALAPLIETTILLDRMLYILEHGLECEIFPAFDPKMSPRNYIIVGRRPKSRSITNNLLSFVFPK